MGKLDKSIQAAKQIYRYYKRKRMFWGQYEMPHECLKRYPQPELTGDQKREIDAFWKPYGIKFTDYSWFQWYYGMTGIQSAAFLPKDIYFFILVPYYNNKELIKAYKDKNFFDRVLPDVPFPKTVTKCINGDFYDASGAYIDDPTGEKVCSLLLSKGEVIIKDAMDTGQGKNVRKYAFQTAEDVHKALREWDCDNFLVQEVIKQHRFFSQFNESSVNIMRINSWYHDGKVDILTPVLRKGQPGYATDCCHINGVEIVDLIGLTKDGHLRKDMIDLDGKKSPLPESVVDINERVPSWDRVLDMIRENAPKLGHFRLVGWDVTVAEDGSPLCIEFNIKEPSPYASQITDGPFFEDKTEEALAFLKDKANQERFIPKWMRT